ncbi:PA0069 family radical SAM protein [Anditalea andensis]|uniref:Radical SAM protein n=1 Tax=Anditalea andensis TaxID=1048983 RepID=A0A074L273_9BACT|nr:PA0069 family radical SAM protein [Anditalea andensis]KEO73968.1 radical SAM protein [Anditalea andensis]
MEDNKFKGRGSHIHPHNPFIKRAEVTEHLEGIDEEKYVAHPSSKFHFEDVTSALSKNSSPDLALNYSINPYQGCEHGCIYCYARNSHTYWGFDAGLGFETNIVVRKNIAVMLGKQFQKQNHQVLPIMLSGNTDCYQPAEKKFQLTRQILKTCLDYRHPISIITKNTLVERDADLLVQLSALHLVHVYFSINHLDTSLKNVLEPRTATAEKKLKLIRSFTDLGIPVGIMVAPIIPGLNNQDITSIIQKAAESGALTAGYTVIRLNGQIKEVFEDWLTKNFPERKEKVLHQIASMHGGKVNDTEWGRRIKGEGPIADIIKGLFTQAKKKYLSDRNMPEYNLQAFRPSGQLNIFDR